MGAKNNISNLKDGVLHLSIHSEKDGRVLLSLWDTERGARQGGLYTPIRLTEEQVEELEDFVR